MGTKHTLDCGHVPCPGQPANVNGRTVQGWTHVVRDGRTMCHACADDRILSCGHKPSPHGIHTTGTAHCSDGREICWTCADAEQVAALKDRKPTGGYISSDGRTVTTWTGGKLGTIVSSSPVRLSMWSVWHGRAMQAIRVRDVHGAMWYGRGSPGIAVSLRPCKG